MATFDDMETLKSKAAAYAEHREAIRQKRDELVRRFEAAAEADDTAEMQRITKDAQAFHAEMRVKLAELD